MNKFVKGADMKEKINSKSVAVALFVFILGIVSIIYWENYGTSVGCSLIASSVVALINSVFVERNTISPLKEWGIKNIYHTRSRMNDDCDISLSKAKYKVDIVAFGIKSYRTEQEKETKRLLKKGVNFRILTMDPDSEFVSHREKEENENPGQIRTTIINLIDWAGKMNRESKNGKIEIKGYKCMTLDFYWRVDDDIYVGPYWYGYGSQQTISYKFSGDGSQGFNVYSNYFDSLWYNDKLTTPLVSRNRQSKRK